EKKAKEDPKTKNYNNVNSRKNLRQYKKEEPVLPEILDSEENDGEAQAQEIVVGRKLSAESVKKLIPQREVFTPAEKKRFTGIVVQYLSDFKNEEPTAFDLDDIFEIAKVEILETRLLKASKSDEAVLVTITQSLERLYKRKQEAKKNLSARRADRKDSRASQDINIVDLVVLFDREQKAANQQRIEEMLKEEAGTAEELNKVLDEDGY
ncbi:MAG: hypothetical protein MI923_24705, partial [Phycisphaerales bacterium]|nr:hypothetical protein [Phycisphaerales bacterium]